MGRELPENRPELRFELQEPECRRIQGEPAVDRFVGRIEVPQILVIGSEILQRQVVFGIQTDGLLEVGSRFGPFALTALDCAESEINFGFVRQPAPGNFEFFLRRVVIVVAVIIREPHG